MVKVEANSGTARGGNFNVFLSFRGLDTRKGFADVLYEFMKNAGIRVFRDAEELWLGENILDILQAVKSSQIYIPIFSINYASSRWCLQELTLMVQCTRQFPEKVIMPIFYSVDPSDVKLQTNLYKSALKEHEDLGCTEVDDWKEALTEVVGIKGWHLKDEGEGAVSKEITRNVLQRIPIRKRELPANLVGIDDRIEAIKNLLDCKRSEVRFVIIHGISGVGKTTLVKEVFNEVSHLFEGCSFLSSVQESCPSSGNEKMQRKLAMDLFGYSLPETLDFEEGNNLIKKILPSKQVLLVFDDMDGNDQLMQLAMHCYQCGPRSSIIITTRDKSRFPVTKVKGLKESISTGSTKFFLYEMKEMHFDHALLLFNKLAFNTDVAPRDLYDLSRKAVALARGLPLAVEEMGSLLGNASKEKWERTLKKWEDMPLENVYQSLKKSYDAVGNEAQQIFLDTACFFVNKKIINAMYMWEACALYPKDEIEVLKEMSLIEVDGHDRVTMQDLRRDLGREIVRRESIEEHGNQSRLWLPEKALVMVRTKQGTKNVVALKLPTWKHNFTRKHFANLPNIRFLELDGGNFVGDFEDILLELRWLYWRNCPPKFQANNFVLNHLVVLKLSGDITEEHWSDWVKIMEASKLKVLKIAGSKSLTKIPCFPELMSLERLVLKDFLSLAEIDRSIGQLEQLTYLKIQWCPSLRELPKEICCLPALRELVLIHCFNLQYLPNTVGNIRRLSRLVMEDTGVVKLPDALGGLVYLRRLCLPYCSSLNSLPDSVGELKSLTELDLSGTNIEELPRSLCNLKDLRLRINKSLIKARKMEDLVRLEDIEDCSYSRRRLEPDGIPSEDPLRFHDYPREIFV